jgi:hypothetical protein
LSDAHVGGPFGGLAEVEDPVKTCTEEEDDVCVAEGGGARGSNVEGVGVWEDSFALRGWEEGDVCSKIVSVD